MNRYQALSMLGLKEGASPAAVESAYRSLRARLDPALQPPAARLAAAVNYRNLLDAYAVLRPAQAASPKAASAPAPRPARRAGPLPGASLDPLEILRMDARDLRELARFWIPRAAAGLLAAYLIGWHVIAPLYNAFEGAFCAAGKGLVSFLAFGR